MNHLKISLQIDYEGLRGVKYWKAQQAAWAFIADMSNLRRFTEKFDTPAGNRLEVEFGGRVKEGYETVHQFLKVAVESCSHIDILLTPEDNEGASVNVIIGEEEVKADFWIRFNFQGEVIGVEGTMIP